MVVDQKPKLIYFIQATSGGPIKIGVSNNPRKRLQGLQTGSYELLALLGVISCDDYAEHDIHEYFEDRRMCGEWFMPDDELMEFIAYWAMPLESVA